MLPRDSNFKQCKLHADIRENSIARDVKRHAFGWSEPAIFLFINFGRHIFGTFTWSALSAFQ